MHSRQVIHRDIKPANILFDAAGTVKLSDLGLSKNLDSQSNMTRSRTGLGTIQFAAPEQFDDARSADARSDVYSLAVTLYVALTREMPFGTGSPVSVLGKKLRNQFDAPIIKNSSISAQMNTAICTAMHADRNQRPASVREFAALLGSASMRPAGIQRPDPPKLPSLLPKSFPHERRLHVRYATRVESSCRPINGSKQLQWPVMINNISSAGVCLRSQRRFEVGNILDLIMLSVTDGQASSQLVRVCRVQQSNEKAWQLGCEFVHALDEHDLDAFLHERMELTEMT